MGSTLPLLFFDIESDDLLWGATKVWCLVGYDEEKKTYLIYHTPLDTGEKVRYPKNSLIYSNIEEMLEEMYKYKLVAHNGISFDLSLLKKLHNFSYTLDLDKIEDTMVLSYLYYPDRVGHSLEDWGEELRFSKGNHTDWSRFSQEMLDYCIRDVGVLRRVHYALEKEAEGWDWTLATQIEYAIADNIMRQEQHGVLFDVPKAEILLQKVEEEISAIERKALETIPKKAVQQGVSIMKPFLKNGEYSKSVKEWMENE